MNIATFDERKFDVGDKSNDKIVRVASSSFFAAALTSSLLHPLDLIKTRLQVSAVSGGAIIRYKNVYTALISIYKSERIGGLYRGVNAAIIANAASWGSFRYIFEFSRNTIKEIKEKKEKKKTFNENYLNNNLRDERKVQEENKSKLKETNEMIKKNNQKDREILGLQRENLTCAFFASIFSTFLVHPLWLIKNRLEMQTLESKNCGWIQYKGWRDCFFKIVKHEKVPALYKGFGAGLWLAPQGALQILVYEELKILQFFGDFSASDFMRGGFSRFFVSAFSYPFQVVRARQQLLNSPLTKFSLFNCFREMYKNEGFLCYYRGFVVHTQRSCLYSGIMFYLFEFFNK